MLIADPNSCFKKINPACVKLLGYSEDELQSKPFIDFVHADDRQATLDEMARQIRNGYSLDFENRYVCKDGSFRHLSWHATFVAEEGITYATARDITERTRVEEEIHRLNRLYAILSNVNLLLIKARSPKELFQQTCQIAVEQGGFLLAWIGVEDPQTSMVTLVAQAGEAQDYMSNLHISTEDRPEGHGPTGISVREGRTVVCNDFLAAPWSKLWRQRGEQAGIRSCVAIPVLFDGKRYGTLSVYASELNVFQEKEVALLEEVAMSISFGLKHLEDESQRRKAELELHNSQELLRDTAEKAKMGGWEIDLRTQELSWTEQIFKIYEVGPDFKPSVSGTIDFYAPESRPVIDRAVRQAIESGEPFDLELCLITAKKNRRDVRTVGTAHFKDGKPVKVTGTFQDITEQKLAEKSLRENELFLREVQRVGHIGTYDLDIAGECWKSSPELDLIFGIDNSNPRDVKAWLNLVHPECRNRMSSHFAASLAARQWFDMEYKIVRPSDGEERWVYGTGEFSFDTDGNPLHMIGTIQDVTERKLIEESLVKSEEKFRSIMALSPDIISIIDEHGVLAYNSPAALAIHGYAAEEMVGKNTFELIHPDDQANVTSAFNGLLMSPSEFVTVQYRYRNKDGSYTWMEATASNQLNNPRINGVVSISRNIADRKELEEQRLDLERRLLQTQKLESLGVLAGGIAHDFNNILTGIMGNISFAKMTVGGSHKAYDILARAEKASQRAADLAKQLVVFAKGGQPVKSRFALQQVVHETIALALAGTNVKAVIDLPEPLNTVEADEGQINQSLHNIIINAVHSMPGGGKLTIGGENVALSAHNSIGLPNGNYVKLSIADEGCGISEDDQKKIFDPYFSTKAGGTGLGLASAYAIINNHDGKISVSSTVGAGTTFTIYLPSLGKIHQNISSETVKSITSQGACSILVMDDEEVVRELASMTLEHFGHRVKTCANGEEAISIYTSAKDAGTPFSVVIMDLTIPGGMGGVEAARRILAVDPDANLIVSSGYSDDPVMSNYERYGFCAAIGKPYKAGDIIEILNMVIQRDKAVIVGCP